MATEPEIPKKILLVRLSALGDVLFGLPCLELLAREMPGVELHWLCEQKTEQLLHNHPLINKLHIFPRRDLAGDWARPWFWPRGVLRVIRFLRELRQERYDAVLDLQGNMKSAFQVLLTRATKKIGFNRDGSKEGAWGVANHKVDPGPPETHRIDKDLRLVEALGIKREFIPPRLAGRPGAEHEAKEFWQGVPGTGPRIVIHPGSSVYNAYKRWPADRYGEVIHRLTQELDARVVVIEGRGEEELIHRLNQAARTPPAIFPQAKDLLQVAALLKEADFFLGGDSAPMHLAHIQGIPCVGIFGPKSPHVYGPYGVAKRILLYPTPCHPCRLRSCPVPLCVLGNPAREVSAAALSLWEEISNQKDPGT